MCGIGSEITADSSDLATRGRAITELAESTFWWEGPSFLKDDKSFWPPAPSSDKTPETCEKRAVQTYLAKVRNIDLKPNHFSTYRRLCRVTAFVLRFITNCRVLKEVRN